MTDRLTDEQVQELKRLIDLDRLCRPYELRISGSPDDVAFVLACARAVPVLLAEREQQAQRINALENECGHLQADKVEWLAEREALRLYAAALTAGRARWEPFVGDARRGEVCVNGLRYCMQLDEAGVPIVHDVLRSALAEQPPALKGDANA